MPAYVLELVSVSITRSGLIARFRGNPYKVFLDIPGGTPPADVHKNKGLLRVLLPGQYDPQVFIDMLPHLPMYDRQHTVLRTENCVIEKSRLYETKAQKTINRKPYRANKLIRLNRMPRAYVASCVNAEGDKIPSAYLFD